MAFDFPVRVSALSGLARANLDQTGYPRVDDIAGLIKLGAQPGCHLAVFYCYNPICHELASAIMAAQPELDALFVTARGFRLTTRQALDIGLMHYSGRGFREFDTLMQILELLNCCLEERGYAKVTLFAPHLELPALRLLADSPFITDLEFLEEGTAYHQERIFDRHRNFDGLRNDYGIDRGFAEKYAQMARLPKDLFLRHFEGKHYFFNFRHVKFRQLNVVNPDLIASCIRHLPMRVLPLKPLTLQGLGDKVIAFLPPIVSGETWEGYVQRMQQGLARLAKATAPCSIVYKTHPTFNYAKELDAALGQLGHIPYPSLLATHPEMLDREAACLNFAACAPLGSTAGTLVDLVWGKGKVLEAFRDYLPY